MKNPFIPIFVCAIVAWLCWGKVADYQRSIDTVEKKMTTAKSELNQLYAEQDSTANQRANLEAANRKFSDFLGAWQKLYAERYTPSSVGSGFSDLAEKTGVFVVENKIETYKGKFMGNDLAGTSYKLRAIGSSPGLFRFLGNLETEYELVGIQNLTISRNLSDIIFEGSLILPQVSP